MFNAGPASKTLGRCCTNVIQMYRVCWVSAIVGSMLGERQRRWADIDPTVTRVCGHTTMLYSSRAASTLKQCWASIKSASNQRVVFAGLYLDIFHSFEAGIYRVGASDLKSVSVIYFSRHFVVLKMQLSLITWMKSICGRTPTVYCPAKSFQVYWSHPGETPLIKNNASQVRARTPCVGQTSWQSWGSVADAAPALPRCWANVSGTWSTHLY